MTPLQIEIFDYLKAFFEENDQLPPIRLISEFFGKYPNQIDQTMRSFARKGLIEKNAAGKYRFARKAVA